MTWRAFYSYSHKDEKLRDRLNVFLAPLCQEKKIEIWHDRKIKLGTNWNKEISDQIDLADIIICLVSGDFLASDYIFGTEMDKALNKVKARTAIIVPILLKSCDWETSRLSAIQFIPRDGKAITEWKPADKGFTRVVKEIRKLVSDPFPTVSERNAVAHTSD